MVKGEKFFNEFSTKYSNDYVIIKETKKENYDSFQITHNNEKYSENKKIISEQLVINELENGNSFKNVSCIFLKLKYIQTLYLCKLLNKLKILVFCGIFILFLIKKEI